MDVAVLGAGYAGIAATRRLERLLPDDLEIALIDEAGSHEIQHEIHRVIRYPALAEALRIPADTIVDRPTVHEAIVTGIDLGTGRIETSSGETYAPTFVIVCLGAVTTDHGIPGALTHGQPCTTVEHARAIRNRALDISSAGRLVVAGAGLSGIQIAGELAALRSLEDGDAEVIIVEQEPRVAPTFPANFGKRITRALVQRDVDVRTNTTIRRVDSSEIRTKQGESIGYDLLVWTGGIRGTAAMNGDRLRVDSDLRIGARCFAAGDAASVIDDRGALVPAAAQTAVRQGRLAAENVSRLVEARGEDLIFEPRLARYRYDPPGWFVSVGDETVGMIANHIVTGAAADAAKTTVGAGYLTSIGAIDQAAKRIHHTIKHG